MNFFCGADGRKIRADRPIIRESIHRSTYLLKGESFIFLGLSNSSLLVLQTTVALSKEASGKQRFALLETSGFQLEERVIIY
jgi:hypothetical protein